GCLMSFKSRDFLDIIIFLFIISFPSKDFLSAVDGNGSSPEVTSSSPQAEASLPDSELSLQHEVIFSRSIT
ncbi:hypothetical protein VIGAN_09167400, partial [Vigna angularis var. angularis]